MSLNNKTFSLFNFIYKIFKPRNLFVISSTLLILYLLNENKKLYNALSMGMTQNEITEKDRIEEMLKKIKEGEDFYIKVRINNSIRNILFSEYILGVTAKEIEFYAPIEAIKAQMVASTTYALKKLGINNIYPVGNTFQDYICKEERIKKYGAEKEKMVENALSKLFTSTVMLYNDDLIESVYDTSVPGRTRENQEVWGNDNKAFHLGYLSSVYSPDVDFLRNMTSMNKNQKQKIFETYAQNLKKFDEFNLGNKINQNLVENILKIYSNKIKTTNKKKINNVFNMIKNKYPTAIMPSNRNDIIEIVSRYDNGFIKDVKIFGINVTGEFLRCSLGLNSSYFDVKIIGDEIVFECLGMGHCVGMSQVGAIIYAMQGWNWKQILKHYYTDKIKFKQLKDLPKNLLVKYS